MLAGLWALALRVRVPHPAGVSARRDARRSSARRWSSGRPPFNFVDLYIPSNPFNSLANNVVPAVVLFSVVRRRGADRHRAQAGAARRAARRRRRRLARHAPGRAADAYGLFAIAATAAGTLNLEQLGRLQVYLVTYVAVALLVGLWVLPGLVAALTPIRVREIFSLTRDALITAMVAGDLFIVLPALIEASKTLLERHDPAVDAGRRRCRTSSCRRRSTFRTPASCCRSASSCSPAGLPTPPVAVRDYPRLAATGLLTFFGSLNAAVPFLLDLFRIPADTFQLFLATGVINSRVGTLVAAMHT